MTSQKPAVTLNRRSRPIALLRIVRNKLSVMRKPAALPDVACDSEADEILDKARHFNDVSCE